MRHARPGLVPVVLVTCCAGLPAQEPALDAADAVSVAAMLEWQRDLAERKAVPRAWRFRNHALYFGVTADGQDAKREKHEFDPDWISVALLWPGPIAMVGSRPVMATSLGHVLVGPPIEPRARWSPTFASVTGEGVEPRLANVLLQTGYANDGTLWRRIDDVMDLQLRSQRVRVEGLENRYITCGSVELGAPRVSWHPAWAPIDAPGLAAMRAGLRKTTDGKGRAEGEGLPMPRLSLSIQGCGFAVALQPGDVKVEDGEVVVTVREGSVGSDYWFDCQARAVAELRRLWRYQIAVRMAATVDRDGDGRGEFSRCWEAGSHAPLGRRLLESHLFRLHVPADPDAAERGFVAYAWPERSRRQHELAFFVDERGVVHACDSAGRFAGDWPAPTVGVHADRSLGWRPLR